MEAKVIAISTTNPKFIEETTLKELENFGAYNANICYTKKDFDEIIKEDKEKTEARIIGNKENNHHSVFGHTNISLYFKGIPKLLAMIINNEHDYNTSEKSARYTKMNPSEKELKLYTKWVDIFERRIKKVYPNESYLTDKTIHKLAMENARYMISVMTPTKMTYTTNLRQLNYIYQMSKRMLEKDTDNRVINMLKPSLEEFIKVLEDTGYINGINEWRNREFSLIVDDNNYKEHYSRSYSTNYFGTYAMLAQAQRHRSLDYNLSVLDEDLFYIPPILVGDKKTLDEWIYDINSVADLIPQGTIVNINETGKYEDFIMKAQDRLCTHAQLEVANQTKETLENYIEALKNSDDYRDGKILDALLVHDNGARCMNGYNCKEQCKFKDGITLQRKI